MAVGRPGDVWRGTVLLGFLWKRRRRDRQHRPVVLCADIDLCRHGLRHERLHRLSAAKEMNGVAVEWWKWHAEPRNKRNHLLRFLRFLRGALSQIYARFITDLYHQFGFINWFDLCVDFLNQQWTTIEPIFWWPERIFCVVLWEHVLNAQQRNPLCPCGTAPNHQNILTTIGLLIVL